MGFLDRLKKKPKKEEKMSDEDLAKMVEENTIPMYDDSHMDLEKGIPAKYVRTKITIPANVMIEISKRKGLDYLNPLKRKKKAMTLEEIMKIDNREERRWALNEWRYS